MILNRQSILTASIVIPSKEVAVPEWGGSVLVRGLTAGERDSFELDLRRDADEGRPRNVRGRLVSLCAVDSDGDRLFTDDDAEALSRLHARPVDRLFAVAARLSGLGPEDVKELEKN
jgi:hypothetical protein